MLRDSRAADLIDQLRRVVVSTLLGRGVLALGRLDGPEERVDSELAASPQWHSPRHFHLAQLQSRPESILVMLNRYESLPGVNGEQRLASGTPQSRAFAERTGLVMALTARLNALVFDDLDARASVIDEIFGSSVPGRVTILPPFFCDYGLGTRFGERVFVNQCAVFSDLGGITIGDRVLIGPRVTLCTSGHPIEPGERFDAITHAPIVIADDVWIGAAVTVTPGVTIGRGSVVGAGSVVAQDVPELSVVTGTSLIERKRLGTASG